MEEKKGQTDVQEPQVRDAHGVVIRPAQRPVARSEYQSVANEIQSFLSSSDQRSKNVMNVRKHLESL